MTQKNSPKTSTVTSMLAVAAAALAVGLFVTGPLPMTGQAPAKGGPGGGGKGGAKQPAGPVPRTKDGHPDMTGFWGGVNPGGNVNIEPAAKGGGKGGGKGGPGGPPGGGAAKGGPGAPGGAPPQVAAGAPGAAKGGPGGGPGAGKGGPGGPGAAKAKGVIIDPEDAKVPYTAVARAKSDDIIANKMFLEPELHCLPSGVPHNMWVQFGAQFVQNKDYLVMLWEFKHDRRIIPLDNRPLNIPPSVRQFQGFSSGHWEGDTLVIHTVNQTARTWFDTSGHYAPADIDVVERLTMSDSNTIQYDAVVTSPSEFTQPMKLHGTISRANANDPTYEQMEFGCVEGNIDVEHYTSDVGGAQKNVGALKP